MATLTDEQLADLREKALAATPTGLGWKAENCSIFASDIVQWGKRPGDGSTSDGYLGGVKAQRSSNSSVTVCACWTDEDAAFIASADPQTVLALIERIGELDAQVAVMVEMATSLGWCPIGVDCPPDDKDCRKCWRDALCTEARKRLGLGEEVAKDGK